GTTNQIPNKETRKQRHPEGQYCSKHLKIFRTFDKWGQSWVNCYTCFLLTVQRYSDFHDSATIGYE
ncbi:MAG: hypothetical protein IKN58_13785, partial [Prevotella sp.]|nr:hypothetical protein [Prevotella sp.]